MSFIDEERFDEYLSDYNRAFSAYLSSKTFASDTVKIFMIIRYLKALVFCKDKLVVKDLRNRNLIASLVRVHWNREKSLTIVKK